MNTRLVALLSCSLGVLLPVVLGDFQDITPLSGQQMGTRAPFANRSYWPPKPSNMVEIVGSQNLEVGESLSVYTVPTNKYLVLTSLDASIPQFFTLEEVLSGERNPKLSHFFFELAGGSSVDIRGAAVAPLGIVFRPGASVELSNYAYKGQPTAHRMEGYLVGANVASMPWPPHPRDLVTFDSTSLPEYSQGSLNLPNGALTTLLDVPPGRSFVMTSGWKASYSTLPISEYLNGMLTPKPSAFGVGRENYAVLGGSGAPLGSVFRAGSQIVMGSNSGIPGVTTSIAFGFAGYFVDD